MVNILLVYPKIPFAFWSMDHVLKTAGRKTNFPPVGLLTVAAMLPNEWRKQLVDLNISPLLDEHLDWADYVFVGTMNVQAESAREVISLCNKRNIKVVAGGPLFTHEFESYEGVDHFVLNEAEITLPRFVRDVKNGCPKPIYMSAEFANVHETPIPLWELVDLEAYGCATVQYSRGCPYQCDFCDVTALFGHNPRTKTPEQIIAELEALGDLDKFDLILFADDNLIGNRPQLKKELLPALIEWRQEKKPVVGFTTQVTINLADDPELVDLKIRAGFRNLYIGIETPEEEGLLGCKKTQNMRRSLVENVHALQRAGFMIMGGFIVGFDTDTPEIFQRQVDFIQESGVMIANVSVLKAPPGTELYDRMKREGRLIYDFDFRESQTNIIPKMAPEDLSKGYEHVLKNLYDPEKLFRRSQIMLKEYRRPDLGYSIPWTELRFHTLVARYLTILWRVFYWVGIRDTERRYFWKLIAWTLKNCPSHVDQAICLGVWIYQLRKLYERYRDLGHFNIYNVSKALADKSAARRGKPVSDRLHIPVVTEAHR